MTADTTCGKVKDALATVANVPATDIRLEQSLVTDLALDSLSVVSLCIALEQEFGEFFLLNEWLLSFEDPSQLTVASLTEYVRQTHGEASTTQGAA